MGSYKSKEIISALFICSAAVLWGFDGVVLTPRLYTLSVPLVVFILHLLPFIAMSILFGKEEMKSSTNIPKKDLIYLFLIALFGGSIGTLAIVKALFLVNFKHLTVVTLLQKLQPVFAIILARFILKEKIGKNFILWSVLSLVAGYFLTFEFHIPEITDGGNILKASFLSLLAAFSFGSGTVFGKKVLENSSFRTVLYLRYAFTSFIMFFIALYTGSLAGISATTKTHWIIFSAIGLTSGSGAILLYYKGLRYIKANVATMCELCFPISSILFDYIFNGNILSPVQWISVFVMLISIYNITQNNSSNQTEKISQNI
ncbi:DMT family transporter [uncultured Ilyobacter sp.]|uniref:DMT family transporter n=1 Tax=uncultured Ilyobacter sp. TaxID=544433 RepID=UPI0029C7A391|nr:DMT family transporter [uncultured Ilyobacter sp.]